MLQVRICHEENGRANQHDHKEKEVLQQQCHQFWIAPFFLFDKQIVGIPARFAIDTLLSNYHGCLAVPMDFDSLAVARHNELGRDLQVLEILRLCFHVFF